MTTGAPDYYKTILLGGLHNSTPILAYIDDDGYFVFRLADDLDAWGNTVKMGLAELAAVLSPAKRFDRRGQLLFYDDFECELARWVATSNGAGGSCAISEDRARSGWQSVKAVAGSDGARYAGLTGWLPLVSFTKTGLEVSVTLSLDTDYFLMSMMLLGKDYDCSMAIKYFPGTDTVQYFSQTGAYIALSSSVALKENDRIFNTFKLVCNRETFYYDHLLINHYSFDMTDKPLWKCASTDPYYAQIDLYNYAKAGKNPVMYIDDVIVTHNEP